MDFLIPIFQSVLASAVYGAGVKTVNTLKCIAFNKRYERAFEHAVCKFYADPKYVGVEARRHYREYLEMLQDASKQDDYLVPGSRMYEGMLELFTQEVSRDGVLRVYTIMRSLFTTQKKLKEISKQIEDNIKLTRANRAESQQEHKEIFKRIEDLKQLVTDPKMQSLTFAPLSGSAVAQNEQESHIIHRKQLVSRCITSLYAGKLLILYGPLKVGKTTLAQLVAKEKEEVEIIDDVAEQNLEVLISTLLEKSKVKSIIVTTPSALNKNLSTLDFSLIEQIEVPLLSIEETVELINTYGPTSDLHIFIYGHTCGHPVLVKTLCSYFATCEWQFDAKNFDQILSYSFDYNLKRSLSYLISKIIPEVDTRVLLNRLLSIRGSFSETEVCQLAEITPQIGEVKRRLYSLIPTWITDNGKLFKTSPLLNKLWQADISNECKKQCNKILAQNILNQSSPLTELDVLNYINYSVNAEEYDNAGHMYITILNKFHDANEVIPKKSLLKSIWIDIQLPIKMSLSVKIGCRLAQLLLLSNLSEGQRNYLLWDLKQLVDCYEKDDYKAFFYYAVALICWQENNVADGLKYYNAYTTSEKSKAVSILSQHGEDGSLLDKDIWIFLLRLTDVREYETWLESFRGSHIDYVHNDKKICNCCYLAVSRLITYHLRESDVEAKQNVLERIWNKAEQCGCPEIAIVSLFKIIDIFGSVGKYDEAKVLYDDHYEKYKDFPLAVILLNGAMAYACYKNEKTNKEYWYYFEQVINFSDKDLIPDIQLHMKELFAYVVAEKDQERSVILLEEALEYANNENHRVDIFEYYQCKGELSYAYWRIGERVKAVELLSDCVDFVLPLAEAEKDFAKTYLCLCNCLLTKYSLDVKDKPLPENQASPKCGMFTESNLMGLDDLFTVERLYVTCYQMSELCENIQMNILVYRWAKKAIDDCRRRCDVKESHSLLFMFIPLLNIDDDIDDVAFILKRSDEARRLGYKLHPELKKENYDMEYIEFQVIPVLMQALTMKIRGSEVGIKHTMSIIKEYVAVSEVETIRRIKDIFERTTYDKTFIAEINKLNVQEYYNAYLCAYIMTAFYSDNDYAFDLLISIMPELQKQLIQIYGLRIMRVINIFISTFWKIRILKRPKEFNDYDLIKDKGLSLIDEYEGRFNQANKTMMVVYNHLKMQHSINMIQEDWLYA